MTMIENARGCTFSGIYQFTVNITKLHIKEEIAGDLTGFTLRPLLFVLLLFDTDHVIVIQKQTVLFNSTAKHTCEKKRLNWKCKHKKHPLSIITYADSHPRLNKYTL